MRMAQPGAVVAGQGFQANLQDALLLDHPRVTQVDRHRPLHPTLGQLQRNAAPALVANGLHQALRIDVEQQAIEVVGFHLKRLARQVERLITSPIEPVLSLDAVAGATDIGNLEHAFAVVVGAGDQGDIGGRANGHIAGQQTRGAMGKGLTVVAGLEAGEIDRQANFISQGFAVEAHLTVRVGKGQALRLQPLPLHLQRCRGIRNRCSRGTTHPWGQRFKSG